MCVFGSRDPGSEADEDRCIVDIAHTAVAKKKKLIGRPNVPKKRLLHERVTIMLKRVS